MVLDAMPLVRSSSREDDMAETMYASLPFGDRHYSGSRRASSFVTPLSLIETGKAKTWISPCGQQKEPLP